METGLQHRSFELRFDGDRTISGTALAYGDVARFPWGESERFEPGAFGDVSQLDLALDIQHDRSMQIARTGGAGLEVMDSHTALTMRAELDQEDPDSLRALRKVKKGILRGLSIAFMPLKHRLEANGDGSYTIVHEQAELKGMGVVDRPQYKQSVLREQLRALQEGDGMNEEQIRALITELLSKRGEADPIDTAALAKTIAEQVRASIDVDGAVTTAVDAALKKRAEEVAAEAEAAEARAKAAKDDKDDDDDDDDGMMKKKKMMKDKEMAEAVAAEAAIRADLIVQVDSLLPKDFDTKTKTRHEILVAAAGEEVEKAEGRSDDYLHAKIEGILERRESAKGKSIVGQTEQRGTQTGPLSAPVSVHSVVIARNRKQTEIKE